MDKWEPVKYEANVDYYWYKVQIRFQVTALCRCSSVSEVRKVFVYVNDGTA